MSIGGITGLGSGIDAMVMQSSYVADKVIPLFEDAIRKGLHPEAVEQEVYRQAGINPADLTWYDKQRIQRKVEEVYQSNHTRR